MLIAVLFLFSEIGAFPSQALANPAASSMVRGGGKPAAFQSQPLTENSWLPPELGSIDEVYRGERVTGNGERKSELETPDGAGNDERQTQNDFASRYPFPVTRSPSIVFIQDAHDSLEAQENIAKIIEHLVTNYGVKTVFEEGYEGPVPTDEYFGSIKDPELKRKVAYFFMDHLRIGGAEYAHINRAAKPHNRETANGERQTIRQAFPVPRSPMGDFDLIGADSLKLHRENVDQYRLSAEKKVTIARDLTALEKELRGLANARFPKEFKEWLKIKEQFDAKKLDLFTYLARVMPLLQATNDERLTTNDSKSRQSIVDGRRSNVEAIPLLRFVAEAIKSNDPVVIEKAKHIDAREVFGELAKLDQAMAEIYLGDPTGLLRRRVEGIENRKSSKQKLNPNLQLFQHYKTIQLLKRLNDLQVTQEEYASLLDYRPQTIDHSHKPSLRAPEGRGNLVIDTQRLAEFIHANTGRPLVLSKQWEKNIRDAVKFYEIANQRDHSLESALDKYFAVGTNDQRLTTNDALTRSLSQGERLGEGESRRSIVDGPNSNRSQQSEDWGNPDYLRVKENESQDSRLSPNTKTEVSVLVFGGFHKENIKRILEARGISYIVVSPRITKPSPRHEDFYKKLMTDGRLPFERAIAPVLARAARVLPVFNIPNGRAEVRDVTAAFEENPTTDPKVLDRMIGVANPRSAATVQEEPGEPRLRSENRSRRELRRGPEAVSQEIKTAPMEKTRMEKALIWIMEGWKFGVSMIVTMLVFSIAIKLFVPGVDPELGTGFIVKDLNIPFLQQFAFLRDATWQGSAGFVFFFTFSELGVQLRDLTKKKDFKLSRAYLRSHLDKARIAINAVLVVAFFQWFWPHTYNLWVPPPPTVPPIPGGIAGVADQIFVFPVTMAVLYFLYSLEEKIKDPAKSWGELLKAQWVNIRLTSIVLAPYWIAVLGVFLSLNIAQGYRDLIISACEPPSALIIIHVAGMGKKAYSGAEKKTRRWIEKLRQKFVEKAKAQRDLGARLEKARKVWKFIFPPLLILALGHNVFYFPSHINPSTLWTGALLYFPVVVVDALLYYATLMLGPKTGQASSVSQGAPPSEEQQSAVLEGLTLMVGGKRGLDYSNEAEELAIMDGSGRVLEEGLPKKEVHAQGLRHMTGHIYFFDPQGNLLFQKRSLKKSQSPGRLQVAVSGHINKGEIPAQGTVREGFEESGVPIDLQSGRFYQVSETNEIYRASAHESTTVFAYFLTPEEMEVLRQNYNLEENDLFCAMSFAQFEDRLPQYPDAFSGSLHFLVEKHPEILAKLKALAFDRSKCIPLKEIPSVRSEVRNSENEQKPAAEVLPFIIRQHTRWEDIQVYLSHMMTMGLAGGMIAAVTESLVQLREKLTLIQDGRTVGHDVCLGCANGGVCPMVASLLKGVAGKEDANCATALRPGITNEDLALALSATDESIERLQTTGPSVAISSETRSEMHQNPVGFGTSSASQLNAKSEMPLNPVDSRTSQDSLEARSEMRAPVNMTLRYTRDFYKTLSGLRESEREDFMRQLYDTLKGVQQTLRNTGVGKALKGLSSGYSEFTWGRALRVIFKYDIVSAYPASDPRHRKMTFYLYWDKKESSLHQTSLDDAIKASAKSGVLEDVDEIRQMEEWFYGSNSEVTAIPEDYQVVRQNLPVHVFSYLQVISELRQIGAFIENNLKFRAGPGQPPVLQLAVRAMQAALGPKSFNGVADFESAAKDWLKDNGPMSAEVIKEAEGFLKQWFAVEFHLLAIIVPSLRNGVVTDLQETVNGLAGLYFEIAGPAFRLKIREKIEEWAAQQPRTRLGLYRLRRAMKLIQQMNHVYKDEEAFESPKIEQSIKTISRSLQVTKLPEVLSAVAPKASVPDVLATPAPVPGVVHAAVLPGVFVLPETPELDAAVVKVQELLRGRGVSEKLVTERFAKQLLTLTLDPALSNAKMQKALGIMFNGAIKPKEILSLKHELEMIGLPLVIERISSPELAEHLKKIVHKAQQQITNGDLASAEKLLGFVATLIKRWGSTAGASAGRELELVFLDLQELVTDVLKTNEWVSVLFPDLETPGVINSLQLAGQISLWKNLSERQQGIVRKFLSTKEKRSVMLSMSGISQFLSAFLIPFVEVRRVGSSQHVRLSDHTIEDNLPENLGTNAIEALFAAGLGRSEMRGTESGRSPQTPGELYDAVEGALNVEAFETVLRDTARRVGQKYGVELNASLVGGMRYLGTGLRNDADVLVNYSRCPVEKREEVMRSLAEALSHAVSKYPGLRLDPLSATDNLGAGYPHNLFSLVRKATENGAPDQKLLKIDVLEGPFPREDSEPFWEEDRVLESLQMARKDESPSRIKHYLAAEYYWGDPGISRKMRERYLAVADRDDKVIDQAGFRVLLMDPERLERERRFFLSLEDPSQRQALRRKVRDQLAKPAAASRAVPGTFPSATENAATGTGSIDARSVPPAKQDGSVPGLARAEVREGTADEEFSMPSTLEEARERLLNQEANRRALFNVQKAGKAINQYDGMLKNLFAAVLFIVEKELGFINEQDKEFLLRQIKGDARWGSWSNSSLEISPFERRRRAPLDFTQLLLNISHELGHAILDVKSSYKDREDRKAKSEFAACVISFSILQYLGVLDSAVMARTLTRMVNNSILLKILLRLPFLILDLEALEAYAATKKALESVMASQSSRGLSVNWLEVAKKSIELFCDEPDFNFAKFSDAVIRSESRAVAGKPREAMGQVSPGGVPSLQGIHLQASWKEFAEGKPLVVEIGAGGRTVLERAVQGNPDIKFIGIEPQEFFAEQLIRNTDYKNYAVLQASDSKAFAVQEDSVADVLFVAAPESDGPVYFLSDPQSPAMRDAFRILKPGGHLVVVPLKIDAQWWEDNIFKRMPGGLERVSVEQNPVLGKLMKGMGELLLEEENSMYAAPVVFVKTADLGLTGESIEGSQSESGNEETGVARAEGPLAPSPEEMAALKQELVRLVLDNVEGLPNDAGLWHGDDFFESEKAYILAHPEDFPLLSSFYARFPLRDHFVVNEAVGLKGLGDWKHQWALQHGISFDSFSDPHGDKAFSAINSMESERLASLGLEGKLRQRKISEFKMKFSGRYPLFCKYFEYYDHVIRNQSPGKRSVRNGAEVLLDRVINGHALHSADLGRFTAETIDAFDDAAPFLELLFDLRDHFPQSWIVRETSKRVDYMDFYLNDPEKIRSKGKIAEQLIRQQYERVAIAIRSFWHEPHQKGSRNFSNKHVALAGALGRAKSNISNPEWDARIDGFRAVTSSAYRALGKVHHEIAYTPNLRGAVDYRKAIDWHRSLKNMRDAVIEAKAQHAKLFENPEKIPSRDPQALKDAIETAQSHYQKMEEVLNQQLMFIDGRVGNDAVDLDPLIAELTAKDPLIQVLGDSLKPVKGSENALAVMLNNFLGNASRFASSTPEGEPAITITKRVEGAFDVIEVSDNGPGMTAEQIANRGYGVSSKGPGGGVGLAEAELVIKDHGGLPLEIRSRPGQGTTFVIRIPVLQPDAQPGAVRQGGESGQAHAEARTTQKPISTPASKLPGEAIQGGRPESADVSRAEMRSDAAPLRPSEHPDKGAPAHLLPKLDVSEVYEVEVGGQKYSLTTLLRLEGAAQKDSFKKLYHEILESESGASVQERAAALKALGTLSKQEKAQTVVVLDGNEVVAYRRFEIKENDPALAIADGIYIKPALRKAGLGTMLFEVSLGLLRGLGTKNLFVAVNDKSEAAVGFHEKILKTQGAAVIGVTRGDKLADYRLDLDKAVQTQPWITAKQKSSIRDKAADEVFRLKEPMVFVIEQARIADMKSAEQKKILDWLLGFARINKDMLDIVILDQAKGAEPAWVRDLKQVASVHGALPGNKETPVFYFSGSDHESAREFIERLGEKFTVENATLVDIDEGRGFVLAALLGKKVEELPAPNGFHRDVVGLWRSELRAAVQSLFDSYVVISSAA
jgi:isopentenyldiphosphate isomerase/L-amino acid N-acyltransferase YncA/SAM-dependent methyltransferase